MRESNAHQAARRIGMGRTTRKSLLAANEQQPCQRKRDREGKQQKQEREHAEQQVEDFHPHGGRKITPRNRTKTMPNSVSGMPPRVEDARDRVAARRRRTSDRCYTFDSSRWRRRDTRHRQRLTISGTRKHADRQTPHALLRRSIGQDPLRIVVEILQDHRAARLCEWAEDDHEEHGNRHEKGNPAPDGHAAKEIVRGTDRCEDAEV